MFRKRAHAATAFAALAAPLLLSGPASAWPFGAPKPAASSSASPSGSGAAPQQGAPAAGDPAPRKATADQRAAAARQPPLVRATFWQHELSLDPSDVEAGLGLSSSLRALGKADEAADIADRMASVAPKNIEVLLEAARAHIAAGHGFYSIQPLRDAIKLAPRDWRPVSLLAIAFEQDERPDDALASYQAALKLSPDNPAVLNNLALFYATRGDSAHAEQLLRQAVAQPAATPQVRQDLALILGLRGKTAEAEKWMRQDLPPDATAANLAYFQASQGSPLRTAASLSGPGPAALPTTAARSGDPTPPRTPAPASGRTWSSLAGASGGER